MAWEDLYLQSLTAPDHFGGLRESDLASGNISNLNSLKGILAGSDSPGVVIYKEDIQAQAQAFWWDSKNLFLISNGDQPYFELDQPLKSLGATPLKRPFQAYYFTRDNDLRGPLNPPISDFLKKVGLSNPVVGKKALTEADWSIMRTNWKSAENVRLQQKQAKQSEILRSVSSSLNTGKASWAE